MYHYGESFQCNHMLTMNLPRESIHLETACNSIKFQVPGSDTIRDCVSTFHNFINIELQKGIGNEYKLYCIPFLFQGGLYGL